MNLLPAPHQVKQGLGFFTLPEKCALYLPPELPRDLVLLPLASRLQSAAKEAGVDLELVTGPPKHPHMAIRATRNTAKNAEVYSLSVSSKGIEIRYSDPAGLRAAIATVRQLLREYGRQLPFVSIQDHPDFPRRGVMLDISRGRVPNLETLLELVDHLADFKINEFQLYTEHTFAYRNYEPVWRGWGPLTGEEILQLDRRCRELGIDLVPNQNSFGHLRYWLEYPPLKNLAETKEPYEGAGGDFLRYPTTLAPVNSGTLPFIRKLFDELLPHFSSSNFNVGCDETWDLGRGQSDTACTKKGKARVYLDFLKQIHKEVAGRGKRMMFWGDIVMHHPELIRLLPKNVIAMNWGYEADHPFERETSLFKKARIPFYVCPGTSTWMTLIGRHDNAFTNLRLAARAGRRNGAIGYLNTDWGDGGHPQPLAVSYLPFLFGAAVSWNAQAFDESLLVPVLSRDVFHDSSQKAAQAALALGLAHRKFKFTALNVTPYGAVIAAPPPARRELFCRDGLKYYARIPQKNILAARKEVERHRTLLRDAKPSKASGKMLVRELDMAARMATLSCDIMLWQQALSKKSPMARKIAAKAIRELKKLDKEFSAYWPLRNKGTTNHCSAFLRWRMDDFKKSKLHYSPDRAK